MADLSNSEANVIIFIAIHDTVKEVLRRVNRTLKRKFTWIASTSWTEDISIVHDFNDTAVGVLGVAPYPQHLKDFDEYMSNLTINSNTRNIWFPEIFAALTNCTLGKNCDNNTSITSFPNYQQDVRALLTVDAVYAFAHALHDFLIDNCNETENAPFKWFNENRTCLGQSRTLNGTA